MLNAGALRLVAARNVAGDDTNKQHKQATQVRNNTSKWPVITITLAAILSCRVANASQMIFPTHQPQRSHNLYRNNGASQPHYLPLNRHVATSQSVPILTKVPSATTTTVNSLISSSTSPATRSQQQQQQQQQQHNSNFFTGHQHVATSQRSIYGPSASSSGGGMSMLRGARNASSSTSSAGGPNSWHFPRISPEHAAEVLITGAQVINRIAQADSPLNFCRTPDNQEGECTDIRKCVWLLLDKTQLKKSVCLRNLIIPAVCCPLSNANNTPMANIIQSALEPVLFRPKPARQRKPMSMAADGSSAASSGNLIGSPLVRPFAAIVNKTIVGQPPLSQILLANRLTNFSMTVSPTQPTTPTASNSDDASATTRPTRTQPVIASQSGVTLFQDESPEGSANTQHQQQQQQPSVPSWNRTQEHVASGTAADGGKKYPWTSSEFCGEGGRTRTGRIVGGSDSKLGQWPWMTAMYLNKRPNGGGGSGIGGSTASSLLAAASLASSAATSSSSQLSSMSAGEFWCGGALINKRFVLTAAHCLSDQRGNRYKTDQVTIKLGGVDLVRHQAPSDMMRNSIESESAHQSSEPRRAVTARVEDTGSDAAVSDEFSWLSFITKALGFGANAANANNNPTSTGEHATKSVDAQRKQQLAAHAKRTYFKEYRVANIKQHPKFQRHGFYNDIGLIELKHDVEYDDLISPVCLPTEFDLKRDMSGYMATVLGWGTLSYGGQGSKLLQQVSMPIWNNKDCDDRYLQHIGKTFVCAGFLNGGKDACQGDSGGPLMVSDKSGRWTLHGVVSFGKTCAQAGYPGVYTRVTEYLDWIKDNTTPKSYESAAPVLSTNATVTTTTTTTTSSTTTAAPASSSTLAAAAA